MLQPGSIPLLDVWRHTSRHPDVVSAIERIAATIGPHFPADLLCVRRVDRERSLIETVALGACRPTADLPSPTSPARAPIIPARVEELRERLRRGAPMTWRRREPDDPLFVLALPDPDASDAIAGVLGDGDGEQLGTIALVAHAGRRFEEAHVALAAELLEPVGIALANDARRLELERLRHALEADRRALLQRLDRQSIADTIVGADSGLRDVMARVAQVAPTDVPVLILGETGTGKEVVARAIHARSRRTSGPVVRVNCGALPPGLVDSELFGHERGSFTGAVATRRGWFERADGGTLFLDEIGELPLDAQVRLLRILQDGTFERVGAHHSLTVDVRLVAATHRDLGDMVARGSFREDLWYRIGVFPIRIPPLRERPEDIPALATHFAWRAGKRLGGAPLALEADDVELIVRYPWPGNVRELASVIERAAILGDGRRLHLAQALGAPHAGERAGPHETAPMVAARAADAAADIDAPLTLDAAMRRHIERTLRATQGRIEGPRGAAARLGINPHTLRARMRKLGLDWARFRHTRAEPGSELEADW